MSTSPSNPGSVRPDLFEYEVQYAVPARQIVAIVGSVFLMVAVFVALAFWVDSGQALTAISAVMVGVWFWLLWSQTNTRGRAVIDAGGFRLRPLQFSVCAPLGELHIPWDEIVSVESGWANGLKAGEFVTLHRTRSPRSLWVMNCSGEAGFKEQVMHFLNQSRHEKGAPDAEAEEAMSSRGWRLFAGAGLVVFAAMVIVAALNPEKISTSMIARLLMIGGFVIALAGKVFSTKRK